MKLFGLTIQSRRQAEERDRAHAASTAEAQAARNGAAELARVIASSPMLGMPAPGLKPSTGLPLFQYDHAIRWSTPQSPQRRPDSLVSLDTMRQIADNWDILRSCIQHLRREVAAVPLEIVPRDKKADPEKMAGRIAEATKFFDPDGGLGGFGRRRSQFEAMWVEDVLVIGASCFFFEPTRGGGLYQVAPIDAATIRPRVDAYGWPGPGEIVYEQWNQGVQVAGFTREQMVYDGLWPVTHSPYFKSAVEWVLRPVSTAIAADDWNASWLKEGNTPGDMLVAPESWTSDMIQDYYTFMVGLLGGNTAARQKLKIAPGGTRLLSPTRRDQEFSELELWMMRRCCSVMGVHPAAIGFAGEQYAVTQENSMEQTSSFGAGQLLEFRKARYDDILKRLGYPDLETVNVTGQEEAAKERADRINVLVSGGVMRPNEGRALEGLDPDPDGNVLLISSQFVPLSEFVQQAQQETQMQEKQLAQPIQQPGQAPQGGQGGAPGAGGGSPPPDAEERAVSPIQALKAARK